MRSKCVPSHSPRIQIVKRKLAFDWVLLAAFAWILTAKGLAAPSVTATKGDNLAAGPRTNVGNNITYTVTIGSPGAATATGAQFADPDPADTAFVSVNNRPSAFNAPDVFLHARQSNPYVP